MLGAFLLFPEAYKGYSIQFGVRGAFTTDKTGSQNLSQNPDAQVKGVSGDDITHHQEQQILPDRLPQSLLEWSARINRRYLARRLEWSLEIVHELQELDVFIKAVQHTLITATWVWFIYARNGIEWMFRYYARTTKGIP